MLNAGMNVTPTKTITLQMINGNAPLKMATMSIPQILLATLRHIPTGGVSRPIDRKSGV